MSQEEICEFIELINEFKSNVKELVIAHKITGSTKFSLNNKEKSFSKEYPAPISGEVNITIG